MSLVWGLPSVTKSCRSRSGHGKGSWKYSQIIPKTWILENFTRRGILGIPKGIDGDRK
jgi:hypothetical protein